MTTSRRTIRQILCATDFSEPSRPALDHAAALARWSGAALTVMHAVAPPDFRLIGVVPPSAAERDEWMEALRVFTEPVIAPASARFVVRDGAAAAEIAAEATVWEADLVVVGTHGRQGLDRWDLGSVAEKVIRLSPVPVLIVPRNAPAPSRAGEPPFRRLLCALDFGPSSGVTLERALSLALRSRAEVAVLHAMEDAPEDAPRMRLRLGTPWFTAYREAAEKEARAHLRDLLPEEVQAACDVREILVAGKAHRRIVQFARDWQADVVVMGVHAARSGLLGAFGSTTARVVRQAPCPVLTVPAHAVARVGEVAGRLSLATTVI